MARSRATSVMAIMRRGPAGPGYGRRMRIAIIGATGRIGKLAMAAVTRDGHEAVGVSRSLGVDLSTGDGLDAALDGVDAVVDAVNAGAAEPVAYFTRTTENLLAAEQRAGVRHHVLLSIVNVDRIAGNPHYDGKVAQENLVAAGPVPWSIVRATQFHDFPEMIAERARTGDTVALAPLLLQPVAPEDVADTLVFVAGGAPRGRLDLAGPRTEDMVDMLRRAYAHRGETIDIVPTWRAGFGLSMSGEALIPDEGALLAATTFEDWLRRPRG